MNPENTVVGWNADRTLFTDPMNGDAYTERELEEMDRDAFDRLQERVKEWEAEHGP